MKPQLAYRSPNQSGAKVIDFAQYLARMSNAADVSGIEALWSTLLDKALASWSWRDPDSLRELEAVLKQLREIVLRDWRQTDGGADG